MERIPSFKDTSFIDTLTVLLTVNLASDIRYGISNKTLVVNFLRFEQEIIYLKTKNETFVEKQNMKMCYTLVDFFVVFGAYSVITFVDSK